MYKTPSRLKIMLLLVIAIDGLTAGAQIHLNAHDKSIRYDLIKPEHSFRKVTYFDTAGNVIRELVVDHLTRIDTTHNEIDFINSVQYAPGKLLIDSSIDNYSGSARYILATIPSTKYEFIKYFPASVEAHNIANGVSAAKTTVMSEGYFDDNSLWDILGYIPFKKGIRYQLDCYGTDTHTQVSIPFEKEYIFDEDNREPGGNVVNSMVLKVSKPKSTNYVWINKKTHLLIKESAKGKGYAFTMVTL
jgi:hypothetical protein